MQEHRKPPKPKHYDTAKKGSCRFCGKTIKKPDGTVNKRANWHKECVTEYKLIYWPRETRKAVWKRDKGICADCGTTCKRKGWELDHRRPLVEAKGKISYWKLENCQTLCKPCHSKKTGSEATERAAKRRKLKEKAKKP